MAELKDSGARRDFGTGAVRDAADGKGRCDLLPLQVVGFIFDNDDVLILISQYIQTGNTGYLKAAIRMFGCSHKEWNSIHTTILEVSKQYEDGCKKYGDRNWEKGIPLHCYIDSGVRHYLKYLRGDKDEPHDRAFVWNILGAIWTQWNKPELIDLPFSEIGSIEALGTGKLTVNGNEITTMVSVPASATSPRPISLEKSSPVDESILIDAAERIAMMNCKESET
mgnify:CR=1 FL=1